MGKCLILLVGKNRWLIKALRLLVESDPAYSVIGVCERLESVVVSQRIMPDIVIFLPEISLLCHQDSLSQLSADFPQSRGIVITPEDAGFYEDTFPELAALKFVSQARLKTDLLPKIREFAIRDGNLT